MPETFVLILRVSKLNKEKKQYKKKVSDKDKHRVGEVQEPPGEINNTGYMVAHEFLVIADHKEIVA